jgi:hypothetical protein
MPPSATLSAAIVKHIRAFVRCACATDAMQPMISSAPLSRFLKYKGTLILFHLRNPAPPGGLGRLLEFYASTEGAKAMPERRDERIVETETEARAGDGVGDAPVCRRPVALVDLIDDGTLRLGETRSSAEGTRPSFPPCTAGQRPHCLAPVATFRSLESERLPGCPKLPSSKAGPRGEL